MEIIDVVLVVGFLNSDIYTPLLPTQILDIFRSLKKKAFNKLFPLTNWKGCLRLSGEACTANNTSTSLSLYTPHLYDDVSQLTA